MLRKPAIPLLGAVVCALGLALTGLVAYLVPVARARDQVVLQGFRALDQPHLAPILSHVAHLADPAPYAAFGLALVIVALVRGRPRSAVAILVLLIATGVTTAELKSVLAHPRFDEWLGAGQIAAAAWPSGHATASLTLAFCGVIAAPARLRPGVAMVGGTFAVAVSYAILALGWHFPSDVFGGYLVASGWTLLAVAALAAAEQRWPSAARADPVPEPARVELSVLAVWAAGVAVLVLLAMLRPAELSDFAREHTTFMLAAGAMAMVVTVTASGLARAVRS